jgi:hypothetical protein
MIRASLVAIAVIALLLPEANAQTYVADLSCTTGPYRVRLPKTYRALRVLAPLKRERVLQKEEQDGHTTVYRELRFNGLELELVTYSNKPNQYVLSSAVLSTAAWRIGGQLRVGTAARIALKGLAPQPYPNDGELEFNGDADSIRVTLSRGRILDVEYSCATE